MRIEVCFALGLLGYYAGPKIVLIDNFGLSEALLSRLPCIGLWPGFQGHFYRNIPKGYLYARETGSVEKMDQTLADYYSKLHLIISGSLWDLKRIKTILEFNLGLYDYLLEKNK
jgi:arabinofuranosyltransferase